MELYIARSTVFFIPSSLTRVDARSPQLHYVLAGHVDPRSYTSKNKDMASSSRPQRKHEHEAAEQLDASQQPTNIREQLKDTLVPYLENLYRGFSNFRRVAILDTGTTIAV